MGNWYWNNNGTPATNQQIVLPTANIVLFGANDQIIQLQRRRGGPQYLWK